MENYEGTTRDFLLSFKPYLFSNCTLFMIFKIVLSKNVLVIALMTIR